MPCQSGPEKTECQALPLAFCISLTVVPNLFTLMILFVILQHTRNSQISADIFRPWKRKSHQSVQTLPRYLQYSMSWLHSIFLICTLKNVKQIVDYIFFFLQTFCNQGCHVGVWLPPQGLSLPPPRPPRPERYFLKPKLHFYSSSHSSDMLLQ